MTGKAFFTLCAALFALTLSWGAPSEALAHSYEEGGMYVGHVWAPPSEDTLVSASTDIAETVRFHKKDDSGESWPENVPLKTDDPVSLAPWSTHIFLSGLKKPLKVGDAFMLKLTFEHAGSIDVRVDVEENNEPVKHGMIEHVDDGSDNPKSEKE